MGENIPDPDVAVIPPSSRILAAFTDRSRSTVSRVRHAHPETAPSVVRGNDGKVYAVSDDAKQQRAASCLVLRSRGLSLREIAAETGLSASTVYRYCRDWSLDR